MQNRTEQNRTEQNRTEQNRTEQNRTEQNISFLLGKRMTSIVNAQKNLSNCTSLTVKSFSEKVAIIFLKMLVGGKETMSFHTFHLGLFLNTF